MANHIPPFLIKDKVNFDAIREGRKTIETRAGCEDYLKICAGDVLVLECDNEYVERVVHKVEHFKSVDELFNASDFELIMPGGLTLEAVKKAYLDYPGYSERLSKYGILAFYI